MPVDETTEETTEEGGTYTLVLELDSSVTVEVGALGRREFEAGWYAYTGSALGPGGFARLGRHREVAAGERDVRHWHIDYLLGRDDIHIATVERSHGVDAECEIARTVASNGTIVAEFGASDCDCDSHLVGHPEREPLIDAVRTAHDELG